MRDKKRLELHVNLKAVLIVLAVAVPLLLLDMFFVLDQSRLALDTTVGSHLQTIAELTAAEASRFVHAKAVEAEVLAAQAEIRRAALAANQSRQGRSEEAVRRELLEVEREWGTPKVSGLVSRALESDASAYLRDYLRLDPSVKRLMLTDAHGAFVAGSHKPIGYYQANEDWWIAAFGDGRIGAVHIGDVQYDPVSRIHALAIHAPVYDSGLERVAGVLQVIVNAAEFTPIVQQVFTGAKGGAMLAKADGTIISSRNVALRLKQKAEETEAVGALARQQTSGYTSTSMRGGDRKLVAFADTRLAETFPDLGWTVIVTQELEEAESPITTINNRALGTAFLGLLLLGAAGAYGSLHRVPQLTDLERVSN